MIQHPHFSTTLLLGLACGTLVGCAPERLKPEDLKRRDRSEIMVQHPPAQPTTAPRQQPRQPMGNEDRFREAAQYGDLAKAKALAAAGVQVDAAGDQGRTALQLASFDGHTETVAWLLKRKAEINHCDEFGRTALMYASTGPNVETVVDLLAAGAEVNLVDKVESFTALMFAAAEGQFEVVEKLLQSEADPTMQDADGETAMDFAKANGHLSVVELLTQSVSNDASTQDQSQ